MQVGPRVSLSFFLLFHIRHPSKHYRTIRLMRHSALHSQVDLSLLNTHHAVCPNSFTLPTLCLCCGSVPEVSLGVLRAQDAALLLIEDFDTQVVGRQRLT